MGIDDNYFNLTVMEVLQASAGCLNARFASILVS